MTGDAAVKVIRSVDTDGSITLVGEERHAPYARPPLSKGQWREGADEHSIFRGTEEHGVDLVLGRRIVSLDLDARNATDDLGDTYAYDRVLLATGGSPRRLGSNGDGVVYFRTLDDLRHLKGSASSGERAVVIGGGSSDPRSPPLSRPTASRSAWCSRRPVSAPASSPQTSPSG
jgi:NAD(P)H-nitrite reductase large subunit